MIDPEKVLRIVAAASISALFLLLGTDHVPLIWSSLLAATGSDANWQVSVSARVVRPAFAVAHRAVEAIIKIGQEERIRL